MIAQVENAILARLAAASALTLPSGAPFLGYRLKTLETYPADWDAFLKEKRQVNSPGIWTGFAGSGRAAETSAGEVRLECSFGLTVIASNRRNEQARRHGLASAGEVGSYQLIEDAIALLVGQDFGLDIDRLSLGAVRHVRPAGALTEMKASMITAELRTTVPIALLPDVLGEGDPAPFEIFHANWDVEPFGGIDANPGQAGIQLPDDAHADATDHLELPQ